MEREAVLRGRIRRLHRAEEQASIRPLLEAARLEGAEAERVQALALRLAEGARARVREEQSIAALLQEYDLGSEEGVLLMCLAEALLRIPDADTADRLIADRLARGRWEAHLEGDRPWLVNAATWGLVLTGRWLRLEERLLRDPDAVLGRMLGRLGEGAMRVLLRRAMALLASQFVLGRDVAEALKRREQGEGVCYSFDCLGEAARTAADAQAYFDAYMGALEVLAAVPAPADLRLAHGLSVKLSALHPRYEPTQAARVRRELLPRLEALAQRAARAGLGLTLDAEEADRLELQLDLFADLYRSLDGSGWEGLGLAVQAYQKRAPAVLDWLALLAEQGGRVIPVRLVKGAYWDAEIKRAQVAGLSGYPVYTRKAATDVSYLACARRLLEAEGRLYPQFASHNAHTLAWVVEAARGRPFEFQRLHGMGEALYGALGELLDEPPPCRIYAPVGDYEDLLPYLVRRLLENGANNSFVNRLADLAWPLERLVEDPCDRLAAADCAPHPRIPLPPDLYGVERRNSAGVDFSDPLDWEPLREAVEAAAAREWEASPLVAGEVLAGEARPLTSPADRRRVVGRVVEADEAGMERCLEIAAASAELWDGTPAAERAAALRRAADLMETRRAELMALVIREGGRCIPDALNEVREAVDFCRYYAARAEADFAAPERLPGPAGEDNRLSLHGRGVFLCISPWNFPLAIFTGQVAAALAAGNSVIAKPARQTPLVAFQVVRLLHEAGVPEAVLHLLPGSGARIGGRLLADPRIAGVAFTGSTETAWDIQQRLAARRGPIVPLIAETGGQNVMIVDSSALPEQVVADVIASAFNSAGQRCSALRALFLQEEIADRVLEMLCGAMDELALGDPLALSTDIGPVIDERARDTLAEHVQRFQERGQRLVKALAVPEDCAHGSYFPPQVLEIDRLERLECEVFGPVLHVLRYPGRALDQVIDAVNATGYGLTLGVHSRIEATWERVQARARVGNLYVNRNMIGAVVGVQPFGGEGLSGTGPKAGGPRYLHRFATERTLSVNTAAMGGNASLLTLEE